MVWSSLNALLHRVNNHRLRAHRLRGAFHRRNHYGSPLKGSLLGQNPEDDVLPLESVEDLIQLIMRQPLPGDARQRELELNVRSSLVRSANRICEFVLHTAGSVMVEPMADQVKLRGMVSVTEIFYIEQEFTKHLKTGLDKRSGYNTVTDLRRLLCWVRRLGRHAAAFAVGDEWAPLLVAGVKYVGVVRMVKHAIARQRSMGEYSSEDQKRWAEAMRDEGLPQSFIDVSFSGFRCAIRKAALEDAFPLLDTALPTLPPLRLLNVKETESLCGELKSFFEIRERYAAECHFELSEDEERKRKCVFNLLCAHAFEVFGLVHLDQILTEPVVRAWAQSSYDRGCKRHTIQCKLSYISTTAKKHPDYEKEDLSWFKHVLDEIPEELGSVKNERDAQRLTDYRGIVLVIKRLQEKRATIDETALERVSWLVHDLLLSMFLILALLPPRCVREFRIKGDRPNLIHEPLGPDNMPPDAPDWARELAEKYPGLPIWQFRLSPLETPMRTAVHRVLYDYLVSLLDEFVNRYRPILVGEGGPDTLFFHRNLHPLSSHDLNRFMGDLTFDNMGRRILPGIIQTSYCYYWYLKYKGGKVEQLASTLMWNYHSVKEFFRRIKRQQGD